jgi:hypothetical protein
MVIFRYPKPFLLENYIRIIAITLNLQKISFYNIINFFYHNSITKFLLSLIFVK